MPKLIQIKAAESCYDIIIGSGILAQLATYLPSVLTSKKICVVTDETVAKIHLVKFMTALEKAGFTACPPIILPAGETSKNFQALQHIVDKCLSYKLDRQSALIALGGGVVGDVTGFAASMLMRGIKFVQIPTTLLSQVDSSVGGKTGINTEYGKNLIGAFYHPRIVLIDTDSLKTLPSHELKAGYAEILKYALINNASFFEWLQQNGKELLEGDSERQSYAIETSCRAKADIVTKDPLENNGIRALLNFGHSFGHALEALGNYDGKILHGEAVGIGSLLAFEFSHELGLCAAEDVETLRLHLKATALMSEPPFPITGQSLLDRMRNDKKNTDGRITLILTKGIGQAFLAKDIDETRLADFLTRKFG